MNPSVTALSPAERYQASFSLYSSGHLAEALALLDEMLQRDPAHPEAMNLAAVCLNDILDAGEAEAGKPAIDDTIDLAEAHNDLGGWFYGRKQLEQAEHAYRRALSIKPDLTKALNNLGLVLRDLKREPEAEAAFLRALAIAPDYVTARNNLGVMLWQLKRLPEAETAYRDVVSRKPGDASAHNNLGLLLLELNRLPEAEAACREALALNADVPEAHNNLGNVLWQQGRIEDAIAAYRQALALRPDYVGAKANLALPLLCIGDYAQGWALYESRYHEAIGTRSVYPPPVPYPQWRGEPLHGKSLLVWPEQGFGDCLQFCRYVSMLKARGAAKVSVACQSPLQRLFESLEGVDAVYSLDGESSIQAHDYWCFMLSLPMLFGTTVDTIPAPMPYLRAPAALAQHWRNRLPAEGRKVGLVWAGDPRPHDPSSNAIDQRRSLTALSYLPLLRVPGVTFVSLQKGAATRPQIGQLPAEYRPFDPMDEVQDFADTAAIVENLDLVITVDTSMAHLAGALNRPVWILSRYDACWRWFRDRDDSPWYPTARLFRQIAPNDWDDVVARVAHALADLFEPAATH
ncbi:tetratricopeptide repeat-containing glycosyltransferase family protein [Paraburkholderia sp. C35]|uniref:tetratricopeptide repeat-containing glycosyltransferase family protein n=1 Tax=Paraburkholderia sp. C35 TaxID=2126993 RepID=UPI000D685E95|nr:tetratricopeptide repeat-containing glycosyltransferase family protein [Paraburkholderia sp. C35]